MVKTINKNKALVYILAVSIFFFIAGTLVAWQMYQSNDLSRMMVKTFSLNDDGDFLIIDKSEKKLHIYEDFTEVNSCMITIGKKPGNKIKPGDNRTPEGIYMVKSIDNSSNWVYDYPNDTLEPMMGAYGPWFIRLEVPGFNGIGIHGFFNDDALGERASHGCIRLNNEELEEIVQYVKPGMPVIILPGEKDADFNGENL